MHSKIFQIGLEPIDNDEKLTPVSLYDNSSDFADYIGDEVTGKNRLELIKMMASTFEELFDCKGDVLIFKGMGTFLEDWAKAIQQAANNLNANANDWQLKMYGVAKLTERTHKDSYSRFYMEDWNCYAGPASDLIEFLTTLEKGTKLYVGAVIDYHF